MFYKPLILIGISCLHRLYSSLHNISTRFPKTLIWPNKPTSTIVKSVGLKLFLHLIPKRIQKHQHTYLVKTPTCRPQIQNTRSWGRPLDEERGTEPAALCGITSWWGVVLWQGNGPTISLYSNVNRMDGRNRMWARNTTLRESVTVSTSLYSL